MIGNWLETISAPAIRPSEIDPVVLAAVTHAWFVYIHPFVDGNGRTARILMNLVLMRYGYPISVITRADRSRYYDALEETQACNLTPFVSLLCDTIDESLTEYERAVQVQRDKLEWARSIMSQLHEQEANRFRNEFELWRSAMELLRGYFKQTVDTLNEFQGSVKIHFYSYDIIDFEKYVSARQGEIIKRSWFFKVEFVTSQRHVRYLFFFNLPSHVIERRVPDGITIHISREERPFYYEKLDKIETPDVPDLREIGYSPKTENFVCRFRNRIEAQRVEAFGRGFIEQVIHLHFLDH